MGRVAFLLVSMIVDLWAAAPVAAQVQQVPVDEPSQAFESLEPFKAICGSIDLPAARRPANPYWKPIDDRPELTAAIKSFCAAGDFVLKPKNFEKCAEDDRLALNYEQVKVITHLPFMREGGIRRFELECVSIGATRPDKARLPLQLEFFDATIMVLRKIKAPRLYIQFSKLLNGARIDDVDLEQGLRFSGVTATGPIRIRKGTIGPDNRRRALDIRNSSLGQLEVEEITFSGDVYFENLNAQEDLKFRNTIVKGDMLARGVNAGADLILEKLTVVRDPNYKIDATRRSRSEQCEDWKAGGSVYLEYARVGKSLRIGSESVIEGGVQLEHARVEGALLLRRSNFSRNVTLDHAIVLGRIVVEESGFACTLLARRVQTSYFGLDRTKADFGVLMHGIVARELMVRGATLNDWFYIPNGKLHVLEILDSRINRLDCSDCVIEQFATLAADYREGARLAGTRIGGSLIFSWESVGLNKIFKSSWRPGAVLDLTGVKTQVVQADDSDLRVDCASDDCGGKALVEARLAGFTFDQFIGGRRTALHPPETRQKTILDSPTGELARWILDSGKSRNPGNDRRKQFDPQPFEVFATALERSGRSNEATELRIFKRNTQLEHLSWISNDFPYFDEALGKILYLSGGLLVGYGYETGRAIWLLVGLVFLGTALYWIDRTRPKFWPAWHREHPTLFSKFGYSLFFSIDRLVPQLTIDRKMDEFSSLRSSIRYYFYVHRALGAIIVTFVLAGLTGLFK